MKHAQTTFLLAMLAAALSFGCGAPRARERPMPLLTEEDRIPDPACDATWIAGLTARVTDLDGHPLAGAQLGACVSGDGGVACLAPVTTDTRGWAVVIVPPMLRCATRAVVRVAPPTGAFAVTYQTLALAPELGVLDVPDDIALVPVRAPTSAAAIAPSGEHRVSFDGELELLVRPDALEDPSAFDEIGAVVIDGRDAPEFLRVLGEPVLAIGFAPDSELSIGASFSVRAPAGSREGQRFELFVLGGLYTPLEDGTVVDEGALARFGTATVRMGRLESDASIPRLGFIVVR